MNISLLISYYSFFLAGPQIPNYYRSFPTARAEAFKAQKEMLIFFSSSSCDDCKAAWNAYSQDVNAVSTYISTQVDAENFDGQILYDYFDPGQVPAWVLLDQQGKIKERWQGGWKDSYGKSTLFIAEAPTQEPAYKTAAVVYNKSVSTSSHTVSPSLVSTSKLNPGETNTVKEKEVKADVHKTPVTSTPVTSASTVINGFVIQAGYFGSETNARKCLADLKAKGFSQFSIQSLEQNGSTFYRIWSETFASENEAQARLQKMTTAGIKGTVKRSS